MELVILSDARMASVPLMELYSSREMSTAPVLPRLMTTQSESKMTASKYRFMFVLKSDTLVVFIFLYVIMYMQR